MQHYPGFDKNAPEIDLSRIAAAINNEPTKTPAKPATPEINISRFTGFGPMPRITANFGEVHAHVLRRGDTLRTLHGDFVRVQAVDKMSLDIDFLDRYPAAQPVRIQKNAFGKGFPANDILLAPAQKIRPGNPRSGMPFVTAASLVGRPFVERARESGITYTRFSIAGEKTVFCEGLCAEIDT